MDNDNNITISEVIELKPKSKFSSIALMSEYILDDIRDKLSKGAKLKEVANEYNVDVGNLCRRLRKPTSKEPPLPKPPRKIEKLTQNLELVADFVQDIKKISEVKDLSTQEMVEQRLRVRSAYEKLQLKIIGLVENVVSDSMLFIGNNQQGVHLKGSRGESYARNSEILKDYAPLLTSLATAFTPQVQITNNQQNIDARGDNNDPEKSKAELDGLVKFYLPHNNR